MVDPSAQIDASAWIGPGSVVEADAAVGPEVFVGPACIIGRGCRIGAGSRLIARVTLCRDTQLGERVLIHAGTGGVGQAAIQIAKKLGLEIFSTAGTDEKSLNEAMSNGKRIRPGWSGSGS